MSQAHANRPMMPPPPPPGQRPMYSGPPQGYGQVNQPNPGNQFPRPQQPMPNERYSMSISQTMVCWHILFVLLNTNLVLSYD